MNKYGRMAQNHYQQHHLDRLEAMADPTRYFTDLGDQTQAAITNLRDRLLGAQRPGENLSAYRARGHQTLRQAEEIVLSEIRQPPPAEMPDRDDPDLDSARADLALINDQLSRLASDWTETSP